jgi:hypothetical protein
VEALQGGVELEIVPAAEGESYNSACGYQLMAQDAGADMICVHPRTAVQMYRGRADARIWEQVAGAVTVIVLLYISIFVTDQPLGTDVGTTELMLYSSKLVEPEPPGTATTIPLDGTTKRSVSSFLHDQAKSSEMMSVNDNSIFFIVLYISLLYVEFQECTIHIGELLGKHLDEV